MEQNQENIKGNFDHKVKDRIFKEGDMVLLWDKIKENPGMHKKFDGLWIGPYKIMSEAGINSFNFSMVEGEALRIPVNAIHLKLYFLAAT
jgi:hypothetical protein